MKKCLFVVGPDWANKYETCKNLISRNNLNDVMLFDISKFFQRKHYKDNIKEDYNVWLKNMSSNETNKLISLEILKRLERMDINKVIITGSLSYNDIAQILFNTKILDYNIIFVDTTMKLLYRNYSLNNNINISFEEFTKYQDIINKTKFNDLKSIVEKDNNFILHSRNNNFDSLEENIANYFGYRNLQLSDYSKENYIWPLEPKYKLLEQDRYGIRPVHMILGTQKFHSGFDIMAESLSQVKASIGGYVNFSGLDERIFSGQSKWNERYGNMIEIVDNYGRKEIYAHLREVLVKQGQLVKQGDLLGLSGCSGGARIPHLHFEIRKTNTDHSGEKNTINPLLLLPECDLKNLKENFKEKPYDEVWKKILESPWTITDDDIPYSKSKKYIR